MHIIIAENEPQALRFASLNGLDEWLFDPAGKQLSKHTNATAVVLDGWARRKCTLIAGVVKGRVALFNLKEGNRVLYMREDEEIV